jgi:hypothetical protein
MRRVTIDFDAWVGGEPKDGEFMIRDSVVSKAKPMCTPQGDEPTVTIKYFIVVLPGSQMCSVPLRPVPVADMLINGGHSWQWDGNTEKPSLTPSINVVDRWHGWVRAGRLVSV